MKKLGNKSKQYPLKLRLRVYISLYTIYIQLEFIFKREAMKLHIK